MITNTGYSAPEKLSKTSREIDARADVYSLAALVNFSMTGCEPRPSQDRLMGEPGLPPRAAAARQGSPAFLAAIDKGFALAAADRHRQATDFRRAVAESADRAGAAEPGAAPDDPAAGAAARRRAAVMLLLLFASLCFLFVLVLLV